MACLSFSLDLAAYRSKITRSDAGRISTISRANSFAPYIRIYFLRIKCEFRSNVIFCKKKKKEITARVFEISHVQFRRFFSLEFITFPRVLEIYTREGTREGTSDNFVRTLDLKTSRTRCRVSWIRRCW